MADITITITADEDDLRAVENTFGRGFWGAPASLERVRRAIVAALPKPRIQVRGGMVLRRKDDPHGYRWLVMELVEVEQRRGEPRSALQQRDRVSEGPTRLVVRLHASHDHIWQTTAADRGLDPDEWEVLLDA